MIHPTTLKGTKDILLQYSGDEYCIIYEKCIIYGKPTLGYWLVEIMNIEGCCAAHNDFVTHRPKCDCKWCDNEIIFRSPIFIVHIPEFIMLQLINKKFVVRSMSDKEWSMQTALGTAPVYRPYLISGEAECEE